MRGRNSQASTMISGRQYAVALNGTIMTFECEREKHTYKIDFSKRPITRRVGPEGCKMFASWWSREKGGCIGECPRCVRDARPFKPGDRVEWNMGGKQGDTGTVVKVTKRRVAIGGSQYTVRVRWDASQSINSHDDRVLRKIN
jgi:hypothetical protein